MKVRGILSVVSLIVVVQPARAGGLFVPGSGAVSTSRAGAAVASADDGEALSINPAGLAKTDGLKLTISATLIQYYMSFSRRGAYDPITLEDRPYEGQDYATVENDPKPPLGIGKFQPLPVLAVAWDLGDRVPGLALAAGLYTPSGYPFRDMSNGYEFQTDPAADYTGAPPPTRYDIMVQESALLLPSIGAAYRIIPDLDVGIRLTAGRVQSKTTVVVWGTPGNVEEDIKKDALFTADVSDGFIPGAGIGVTYRIGPMIELGANWTSPLVVKAKGTAQSIRGPSVDMSRQIGPVPDNEAICAEGGTMEQQKACISLQLPMTATIGGRYKFLDGSGTEIGDIELNANWENWGKTCDFADASIIDSGCTAPGQYRVQIDAGLYTNGNYVQKINSTSGANQLRLGLKDTFGLRLGGSYKFPMGDSKIVARGGLAYDTRAAKEGWLRTNFDGASRHTIALGGAYEAKSWQVSAGFGYIHEGTQSNPGANADGTDCNPTESTLGCSGTGANRPLAERQGPDPTNPLLTPDTQFENPYNQGSITSSYLMFMLGFSKNW
ncbi:MAG TPA: outer membrane protein transport protein [Kofleriaceae bacterium]